MGLCGYHLRCSNYGNICSECRHRHSDKNKDYLHDVLNVWGNGKNFDDVVKPILAQELYVMQMQEAVQNIS